MTDAFRLAEGVGWADFRDSVVVVVDRTMVRIPAASIHVRALFEHLAAPAALGELERVLPGVDVADLMRRLSTAGVVVGGAPPPPNSDLTPTLRHSIPAGRPLRIGLAGDEGLARDLLPTVTAGSRSAPALEDDADVLIVAGSSPAMLSAASAACWRAGTAHLPLSAYDGRVVLIGPLALPGYTACFDCLTLRRGGATAWPDAHWDLMHADNLRLGWAPVDLDLAMRLAVRVAERALIDDDDHSVGQVTAWTPRTMSMYTSRLWSVPRCPTCSAIETFSTDYPWSAARRSAMA